MAGVLAIAATFSGATSRAIPAPSRLRPFMFFTPMTSEVRELKNIIAGITSGLRNTFSKCVKAGELLTKIKAETRHGDLNGVLESVGMTFKTAQRYMTVWERRSELNINEIKTLSDAENVFSKIGGLPITTTQYQGLTYEKTSTSRTEIRSISATSNDTEDGGRIAGKNKEGDQKSLSDKADKVPRNNLRPDVIEHKSACSEFGDGYRGHSMSDFYVSDRDPSDKTPASTKEDVAAAREISDVYPKKVSFELQSRAEEDSFVAWTEGMLAARCDKNGHVKKPKIDLHAAIKSVCDSYKAVTGKTLPVKPLDAGQLRRLLESGITLEEFIEVGEKAWKSKEFLARYSHQLATFVKHYGNIRHEIENPKRDILHFQKEAGGLKGKAYENSVRIIG